MFVDPLDGRRTARQDPRLIFINVGTRDEAYPCEARAGGAAVSVRTAKMERDAMVSAPSDVAPGKHGRYERRISAAQKHPPIKVAVAHPCDMASMCGVAAATRLRLIEPILVGPVERLRNAAEQAGLEFENFEIVGAAHSHDSATRAVALVAAGRVDARRREASTRTS